MNPRRETVLKRSGTTNPRGGFTDPCGETINQRRDLAANGAS